MAVVMTGKRVHAFKFTNGTREIATATLTGTYVAGGFTFNCSTLGGSLGSSPYGGGPIIADWYSPTGYIYVSTFSGPTMTTKIFSAPGTELAAGALPDASVTFALNRRLVS